MKVRRLSRRRVRQALAVLLVGAGLALLPIGGSAVSAAPVSVTAAGTFQSEVGCASDWSPDCAVTHLVKQVDGTWRATFTVPAGIVPYQYKIAIDDSWDENYGAGGVADGDEISFDLPAGGPVTIVYDPFTHYTTTSANGPIVTVPGDFQSELTCSSDWAPDCLASWLTDPDGDGVFTWATADLPLGDYQAKIAHNLSWDENYGAGGAADGEEIEFTVPTAGEPVYFSYVLATHILTITVGAPAPGPTVTDTVTTTATATVTATATATVTATSTVTATAATTLTTTATVNSAPTATVTVPTTVTVTAAGAPASSGGSATAAGDPALSTRPTATVAAAQLASTGSASIVRLLAALLLIAFGVIVAMVGSWPRPGRSTRS